MIGAPRRSLSEVVAWHALAWWWLGGAAGCVLATLLVVPELSRLLGPLTYGRWAPVHLNLTLYGALAVPWVGVLLSGFGVEEDGRKARGRWALAAWSLALTLGTASWLSGQTSGKLFLDWVGPAKWAFLTAQALLALVLLESLLSRRTQEAKARWDLWLLWGLLAIVPWAMARASGSAGYPPVNPASGGPTGNSLLGSSLGLVFAVWLTPRLLGLSLRDARRGRGLARLSFIVFATQCFLFWALGMGDHSNRELPQLLALATVALWTFLLAADLRRFDWPAGSRAWSASALFWGLALALDGLVQFLPLPLLRGKFTHLLVAHAHLAMAGFTAAVALLLLHVGLARVGRGEVLTDRPAFLLWNGGTLLHCVALFAVGLLEARDPACLFRGGTAVEFLLWVRWFAGGLMLLAPTLWLRRLEAVA